MFHTSESPFACSSGSQGGLITTLGNREDIVEAILDFEQNVTDPKAAILPSFVIFNGVVSGP